MKYILLLAFIAVLYWSAWVAGMRSECKQNGIPLREKVCELWSTPFWAGPQKMIRARDVAFNIIGFAVLIFYLTYSLVSYSGLNERLTFFFDIYPNSKFCFIILLILTFFIFKHSLKQRLYILFIELFFVADIFIFNKNLWLNKAFIPVFTLILIANELKTEKIVKAYFFLASTFFAVTSCLSAAGVIESGNLSDLASRGTESGWLNMRYAFGFVHPNTTGIFLAVIVVMWFLIRSEKIKWWDWLIFAAAVSVITVVIDSRGALVFLIVFAVAFITLRCFPKLYTFSVLKYPVILSPAFFAVMTFLCALFYDDKNAAWVKLNKISTGRLYLIKEAFDNYKFTVFGQITDKGVDNAYLSIYIQKGVFVLALTVFLYCVLIKRLWNRKATPELALVMAYMVYYLIEDGIFFIVMNISLCLLASIILLEPEDKQQIFCSNNRKISKLSEAKIKGKKKYV